MHSYCWCIYSFNLLCILLLPSISQTSFDCNNFHNYFIQHIFNKSNIQVYLLLSVLNNRQPNYRKVRSLCFVLLGCYSLVTLIHIYALDKFDNQFNSYMVWYWCGMAFFNLLGAFLYASRIPERFYPGYFDFVVRFTKN